MRFQPTFHIVFFPVRIGGQCPSPCSPVRVVTGGEHLNDAQGQRLVCDGRLALAEEGYRKWVKCFPGLGREQMAQWQDLCTHHGLTFNQDKVLQMMEKRCEKVSQFTSEANSPFAKCKSVYIGKSNQ